jgi:hypothetical protein
LHSRFRGALHMYRSVSFLCGDLHSQSTTRHSSEQAVGHACTLHRCTISSLLSGRRKRGAFGTWTELTVVGCRQPAPTRVLSRREGWTNSRQRTEKRSNEHSVGRPHLAFTFHLITRFPVHNSVQPYRNMASVLPQTDFPGIALITGAGGTGGCIIQLDLAFDVHTAIPVGLAQTADELGLRRYR